MLTYTYQHYMFTYINTYLTSKLTELSIFSSIFLGIENSFPPYRILFMCKYAGFHAENCALILMHLNRFTSVWMPITHSLIWKPRNINLAFLFIFLFANAINFQNLLVTVPIFVQSDGYAVSNSAPLNQQIPFTWLMLRVAGHAYPLISLLINVGIFAKLFILRFSGSSLTTGNTVEIHLLLICVASLCMQIGLMIFVDFLSVRLFGANYVFALNIVSDFSTLSEAYFGLCFNETLRQKLFRMIFRSCLATPAQYQTSNTLFQRTPSSGQRHNHLPKISR